MSVIRYRLSAEQFDAIHLILLGALRAHGLLSGRQLGIDSSVIEANASLHTLEHRNTEQSYWDKAVRRFDKKRPGRKNPPVADQQVLARARQAVQSERGKALLRQRGQHVERAFCHLPDHGGLRRATLQGEANLPKRYLMGAFTFNLSLLLCTVFGLGTPT